MRERQATARGRTRTARPPFGERVRRRRLLVALLVAVALSPIARADGGDGAGQDLMTLDGQKALTLVEGAGQFRVLHSSPHELRLGLVDSAGRTLGVMDLLRGPSHPSHRFHTASFTVEIGNVTPDLSVVETLVKAAHTLAQRDDGALAPADNLMPQRFDRPPPGLVPIVLLTVLIAVILGTSRRWRVSWNFRLPHLLPASIQVAVFTYWSFYWPGVRDHVPSLLLQLVMAFALDASFSFWRFGSWRLGAAPIPVTLSTNLFAWFDTPGIVISLVTAFGAKALIRRGEIHVFNPSVIGLTVGGLCAALFPDLIHFGGVFHLLNVAPNMAELVILAAMVPQLLFRIMPVSLAMLLTLVALGIPAVFRPAMLLAMTFLVTDPPTIPKTDFGKILFGIFLGAAAPMTSILLRSSGRVDDFSKVIPVAIACAILPVFDGTGAFILTLAARATATLRPWLATRFAALTSGGMVEKVSTLVRRPVPNVILVGCWLLIVVPGAAAAKPGLFEPTIHWTWGTPLVVRGSDDVPRCEQNPVFCRPFSFVQEASGWIARLRERPVEPPATQGRLAVMARANAPAVAPAQNPAVRTLVPASTDSAAPAPAAATPARAPDAPLDGCRYGITQEMTERIFKFVTQSFPTGSPCAFAGIETRKTVLDVRWTLGGTLQEPLRVTPAGCRAGGIGDPRALLLDVPPQVTTSCADLAPFVQKYKEMIRGEQALVGVVPGEGDSPLLIVGLAVLAALAIAVGTAIFRRPRQA